MQVEASKQSAYKFLMVLTSLRDWEICAPDVSAAIEFCREKIVEMSVEEYEDWFRQQFPKVRYVVDITHCRYVPSPVFVGGGFTSATVLSL